ncbi:Protein of unknown function DUF924, bacterial [gamma proteobacterium HdN1]|nr:Protein of unknown function DUF924, bacterial [gamma proteobacterium HdN1]
MSLLPEAKAVLDFWFMESEAKQWFFKDAAFDQRIRERFLEQLKQAAAAELYPWRTTAEGRLAEIIVLDQFSRNVYRDSPQAFSQDSIALVLAQEAVEANALAQLNASQRSFLLMPYMHSESRAIHQVAEALFKAHTPANNYDYELRHKEIIDRFGRYPHRNEVLGRTSSEEEIAFLKQPGSSF